MNNTPSSDELPVFYIDPIGGHRGMHYYDFGLCPALQSLGIGITLLTCSETKGTDIPASLRVEFPFRGIYGSDSRVVRGLRYLRGLAAIALAMQRRHIALAHFHYFHFVTLDYLYCKWLRLIGKRLVFTVHDVTPFDAKPSDLPWLRRLYHQADRIIVHTLDSQKSITEKFGIGPDRVRVIPHGHFFHFSREQALPAELAKRQLGLDANTRVVLFFGQIKKVKGLQYLIRAFRQVLDQYPGVYLVVAGPEWKESFASYASLIEDLGIAENVLARIEYVPDEEVGKYFSAADVVALPYTEAYQSGVLYMAYSFIKPVVASAVGGLAEVVEHGRTGLLVAPTDVDGLASSLLTLLQDAERGMAMGLRGHAMVDARFGWPGIARKTAEVYIEALSGND